MGIVGPPRGNEISLTSRTVLTSTTTQSIRRDRQTDPAGFSPTRTASEEEAEPISLQAPALGSGFSLWKALVGGSPQSDAKFLEHQDSIAPLICSFHTGKLHLISCDFWQSPLSSTRLSCSVRRTGFRQGTGPLCSYLPCMRIGMSLFKKCIGTARDEQEDLLRNDRCGRATGLLKIHFAESEAF